MHWSEHGIIIKKRIFVRIYMLGSSSAADQYEGQSKQTENDSIITGVRWQDVLTSADVLTTDLKDRQARPAFVYRRYPMFTPRFNGGFKNVMYSTLLRTTRQCF